MSKDKKSKKNNLADQSVYDSYKNQIPADQIWDFCVEGLQEPHINKPIQNAKTKKAAVIAILLVAIGLSIFFSVRVVHNDTFKYKEAENGFELIKFSNPGEMKSVEIDFCATEVKSNYTDLLDESGSPVVNEKGETVKTTVYTVVKDDTKPITVLHEYAFNCDEKITEITIGKNVAKIDGKSFYSCYALKAIHVDPANEFYCDINGVLFNKDKTELICYPIDHDQYLREQYGFEGQYWPTDQWKEKNLDKYNDLYTHEYEDRINTYVVPETVKVIGELAFNYSELFRLYLPEGLERLETLAIFRNWHIERVDTYTGVCEEGKLPSEKQIKPSLPDSLTYIGSDCFNSAIEMDYIYIPENVTYIGHHAFWGAARKENGVVIGLYEIHAALSEEEFKKSVETGDQWTGEYDNGLFPKKVPVIYGETRLASSSPQAE